MLNKINIFLVILLAGFIIFAVFKIFRITEESQNNKKLSKNHQALPSDKKQHLSRLDKKINEITEKQEYLNKLDKIKEIIIDDSTSPTEVIRLTMEFVHNNSLHIIDEEHRKYAFNMPFVMNKLLFAYQGHDSEKPHLSCGPRSYAMRAILAHLSITSRPIQVYSDNSQEVQGHYMLEVFNPETESWEVWDPHFRVTYINSDSKRRLDIMTIIFGDKNKVVPQDRAIIGWKETKTEHLKEHYFEAVLFENFIYGQLNSIIIINRHKFDLGKTFSDGLTFKEWAIKYYKHPRFIILPNK